MTEVSRTEVSRSEYVASYGPTVGDRIRLADTDLVIQVEQDHYVGGDTYLLDIHVGAGSTLVLRDVGATLVLPGPHGELSRWVTRLRVEDGATCVWIAEPVIAARNCHHQHIIEADLAGSARLLFREELVLGRHLEDPGSLSARLSVRRDGVPSVIQQIDLGPGAVGSRSPSVLGGHRAVGNVVVVDSEGAPGPVTATPDVGTAVMR